jgi:DNA-binding IscR family transcriptional regulator
MREVWIAVRASLRSVLEQVTLADVVSGELPGHVRELLGDEDAWVSH